MSEALRLPGVQALRAAFARARDRGLVRGAHGGRPSGGPSRGRTSDTPEPGTAPGDVAGAGTVGGGTVAAGEATPGPRGSLSSPSLPATDALPTGRSAGAGSPGAGSPTGATASPAAPGGAPEPRHELPLPETEAPDSQTLVERAKTGDAEAFGQLYDRYFAMVYRYIRYRVASAHTAEELTSDTFLRALRSIGTFTWQGRDVGAWFVTIARNLVADHYKSARYRLEITTDDVSSISQVPLAEGPEQAVLEGLRSTELLDAVRRLSAPQQECIALRFLQGLTVAETALVMGKNHDAVKALQHRAVRRLGALLDGGEQS